MKAAALCSALAFLVGLLTCFTPNWPSDCAGQCKASYNRCACNCENGGGDDACYRKCSDDFDSCMTGCPGG